MTRPTSDTEAEIVRLHFAEHWKVGTIATQLGVHPDAYRARAITLDTHFRDIFP